MSTGTIVLIAVFVVMPLVMMISHRRGHGGRGSMMGGCGHSGHGSHTGESGEHGSTPEEESAPPHSQGEPMRYGSDGRDDADQTRPRDHAGRH